MFRTAHRLRLALLHHRLEIVRGNTATHILNGRLMSITIDDDAPNRKLDGLIGMQVHTGPPG